MKNLIQIITNTITKIKEKRCVWINTEDYKCSKCNGYEFDCRTYTPRNYGKEK